MAAHHRPVGAPRGRSAPKRHTFGTKAVHPEAATAAPGRTKNSSPMNDINPPTAATCQTGAKISAANGNPNTPTRAPHLKLDAAVTAPHTARQTSAAYGDNTNAPPTKHMTAFPPWKRAKTGNACPAIAPATPANAPPPPAGSHPPPPAPNALD